MALLLRRSSKAHISKNLFASALNFLRNVSETFHHHSKVLASSATCVSYSTIVDDESPVTRSSDTNTSESVWSKPWPAKRLPVVPSDKNSFKSYTMGLIFDCLSAASNSIDRYFCEDQIRMALYHFKSLKDRGVKIDETSYRYFLLYLCHDNLVEDFFALHTLIIDSNPDVSHPELAFYEMMLWQRVNNVEKIQELCRSAMDDSSGEKSCIRGYVLQALGFTGDKKQFLMLLDGLDIKKVTNMAGIFRCLGKLELEDFLHTYIMELRLSFDKDAMSDLIYQYGISIPNFPVEDVDRKVRDLHTKFEVYFSNAQHEKLSKYCREVYFSNALHEKLSKYCREVSEDKSVSFGRTKR